MRVANTGNTGLLERLRRDSGSPFLGLDDLPGDGTVRAALYERVSALARTDAPKTRQPRSRARSIRQQNADNVRVCEDRYWTITGRYQDPGISASRFTEKIRPEHIRFLQAIADREMDIVVMWECSRGDRKLPAWSLFLEACRTCGILIYITSDRRLYDVRNSRDWQTLAEEGIDAAMESEKLSKRCLRGQADSAVDGRPHGVTPYGYERVYDPATGELTDQRPKGPTAEDAAAGRPGEADVVREIVTKIARGYSLRKLAAGLKARGIPSPAGGDWSGTTLRRLTLNPAYIGKRRHNGNLYDAIWPAILKEDVYWAAVRVLTERTPGTRPGGIKHLLSYLAVCGECGDELMAYPYRGGRNGTPGPFYGCRGKGCTAVYKEELDWFVEMAAWERLAMQDLYPRVVQMNDAEIVAARTEAAKLHVRLEEFTAAAAAGTITAERFGKIEKQILADIAAEERRAATVAVPLPLRELAGQPYATIRAKWRNMPVTARRAACEALFEQIAIRHEPRQEAQPRWEQRRQKWVVEVRHKGRTYHWSSHDDRTVAQDVMNRVRAEISVEARRPRGTYSVTPSRVILKLRQYPGTGGTHT